MSQKAYHLYLFFRLSSLYFSVFGLFRFYIFLINNYKNTKNIFCVRKNISVRFSSVTQYVTVSGVKCSLLLQCQQNHFDLTEMYDERQLPYKKERRGISQMIEFYS